MKQSQQKDPRIRKIPYNSHVFSPPLKNGPATVGLYHPGAAALSEVQGDEDASQRMEGGCCQR